MIDYGYFVGRKHAQGKFKRKGEVFRPIDGFVRAMRAVSSSRP